MAEPAYRLTLPEREDGRRWPAQGEWTYEDYLRLPDDGRRYEVIRGTLYVAASPSFPHQYAVTRLSWFLQTFVNERDLGIVLVAPFDVKLPHGIATPVEPDILFVRAEKASAFTQQFFDGTPDLIVEVLSPKTYRIDQGIKFAAYREAGVPEYWLADPRTRTIVVYALEEDGSYREIDRGGPGGTVTSAVLPGLRIAIDPIFLRP